MECRFVDTSDEQVSGDIMTVTAGVVYITILIFFTVYTILYVNVYLGIIIAMSGLLIPFVFGGNPQ